MAAWHRHAYTGSGFMDQAWMRRGWVPAPAGQNLITLDTGDGTSVNVNRGEHRRQKPPTSHVNHRSE